MPDLNNWRGWSEVYCLSVYQHAGPHEFPTLVEEPHVYDPEGCGCEKCDALIDGYGSGGAPGTQRSPKMGMAGGWER